MRDAIRFLLGDQPRELRQVSPTLTVLEYLRGTAHLTGTKEGCAEGDCGACTVVLVEATPAGLRQRAVNACILFVPALDGKQLLTVEHLRQPDGALHPVQQAMVEYHASQCGFCTPGFVMSLFALQQTGGAPDRTAINEALAGNLCRCTGYRPIVDAAMATCAAPADDGETSTLLPVMQAADRLRGLDTTETLTLTHAGQTYIAPRSIDELAETFRKYPDAVLLAGGTDVGLWVTKQHRDLPAIVALDAVADLARIGEADGMIRIGAALAVESFVLPTQVMARGDAAAALAHSPHRLAGRIDVGGQEHFYLEGQIAMAVPGEDGDMLVYASTQHPTEVQHLVARALGISDHAVMCETRRMGDGFGGKESQASLIACIAALLAQRTKRPVKLRLDRDDDMVLTGKRHDFRIDYDVGFDADGRILGAAFMLAGRCGMSPDLSGAINDRAMLHMDNCYYLDNVRIVSHRCKTNTVSNTAFRGFGGPQGMMGIEQVVDEITRHLRLDPLTVRQRNFYGITDRNVTPYHMVIEDNIIPELVEELAQRSAYAERRAEVAAFNAENTWIKRGLALTPLKFGISFTLIHMNQAGALVHVYTDGSVQLNHGGAEMGQGLYVKVAQVVAAEFGIALDRVKSTATTTAKVPNTSPTAASSGTDLNGMAAQAAARSIKQRMAEVAASEFGVPADVIVFSDGMVSGGGNTMTFAALARLTHRSRVSLSSTGYYRTPKIHYDSSVHQGRAFYYLAYGAAVSEVEVDTLIGEYRLRRVDILHDCGQSLNPAIDLGQIEGGFVQGMGWLTSEELWWDDSGRLRTHAPSTYKIPTCGDVPARFNVGLYEAGRNPEPTIYRSKAVGEPPLMLGISVFHALKDAVASVGDGAPMRFDSPATPERVPQAIDAIRARIAPPAAKAAE